ncbi:hypothetical protein GBAR_LOCUS25909 [Geodia barretti]|uniref:Uncharacterized protein n=2 Tax=Geodia barretti TaxID=519541 RepID=A0AA35TFV2_GEOBA|nr:hypothetical protein GBAR_LOCUS25909 [Geodia barretti]
MSIWNSCRAIIPGDGLYKANFTQTTTMDRGFSSLFFSRTYDLRSLELVADIMEPDYLSVTGRVNGYCNDSYTVTLAFGTGPKTGGCKAGLNATSVILAPGDTNRFFTYTDSLPLPANHTYCYLINGVPHAFIDAGPSPGPSGATVTLSDTLLMILLVAVALG